MVVGRNNGLVGLTGFSAYGTLRKPAYGTLRNETKRNGTLRNGTLRNGYNTMLHHTLSRVPRIPLKAQDL